MNCLSAKKKKFNENIWNRLNLCNIVWFFRAQGIEMSPYLCDHLFLTAYFKLYDHRSNGLMEQQFCSRWMSFIIVADSDDHLSFWESNVTDVPTDANFVSRKSNPVFKNYSIAPNAAQIGLVHLGGKSLQTWTPSIHLQGSITRSHLSWKDVSNHFNQFMWPTLLLFNANLAAAWIC